MKRIVFAASLAVMLPSAARSHQDPEPAQLGDRVRVTCPALSPRPVIGTLLSTSEKELVVERADGQVSVPRDAVVALEKSLGRRPRRSTRIAGAVLGGLAAAVLQGAKAACPAICYLDSNGQCLNPCFDESSWEVGFAVASIAASAAIGWGVGSLFKVERWQPAGRTALTVEAAPTRGGARVSFNLRF